MDLICSDKGYEDSLLMLPGWGFDHSIFNRLDLPFNIVVPSGHIHLPFSASIMEKLKICLPETFFVMGWSLGAVAAVKLAEENMDRLKGMFLLCLRTDFSEDEIAREKKQIDALGIENYLKKFYKRCFAGQMEDYRWFQNEIERHCLKSAGFDQLVADLDYLKQNPVSTLKNIHVPVKLFYGSRDLICPSEKAPKIRPDLHKKHIVDCGHLPFLRPDFKQLLMSHYGEYYSKAWKTKA